MLWTHVGVYFRVWHTGAAGSHQQRKIPTWCVQLGASHHLLTLPEGLLTIGSKSAVPHCGGDDTWRRYWHKSFAVKIFFFVLQELLLVPFFLGFLSKLLFISFVHTAPTPPTFFTKVVNSSSVQVLWELPSKAGKAEGFRLFYRRVPHALFQGPIQLPCLVNAHTLADLGTHALQILYSSVPLFFKLCVNGHLAIKTPNSQSMYNLLGPMKGCLKTIYFSINFI